MRSHAMLMLTLGIVAATVATPAYAAPRRDPDPDFSVTSAASQLGEGAESIRPVAVSGHGQKSLAFSLSPSQFAASEGATSVLPSQLDVSDTQLAQARELVVNNPDVSGPRAGALQLAIWHVMSPTDPRFALSASARRIAERVSGAKLAGTLVSPQSDYDLGLRVSFVAYTHHLQTVDFRAVVRDTNGAPVASMTVVLNRDDEPMAARQSDANGVAEFNSVSRPTSDKSTFVAAVEETVAPGALARSSSGTGLIVSEGYRLSSTSRSVSESRLDVAHLKDLISEQGVAALISSNGIVLVLGLILFVLAAFGLLASLLSKISTKWAAVWVVIGVAIAAVGVVKFNAASEPPPTVSLSAHERESRLTTLPVAGISAESTYPANECGGCTYEISKATDGSLRSAWVSAPDVSQDQSIDVDFGRPQWLTAIVMANGNQLNSESYHGNGRVRVVEVFSDGGTYQRLNVPDPTLSGRYKKPGRVTLALRTPILTRYLHLDLAQYSDNYYNVAISELAFMGHRPSKAHSQLMECTAVGYPRPSKPC